MGSIFSDNYNESSYQYKHKQNYKHNHNYDDKDIMHHIDKMCKIYNKNQNDIGSDVQNIYKIEVSEENTNCHYSNYDPEKYKDKIKIREKLGYGEESLIICSIGGRSIGKGLLELCNQAYPIIKEKFPGLRMVLVAGPRLSPKTIKTKMGVEIRGYVPELYQHYAACDLAIVQGGLSSTLELTALRRPFIFFPIEGHSEQESVAKHLARYNAGIKMYYSKTTPDTLAEQVISNLNKEVFYRAINTDGAQKAAKLIYQLLNSKTPQ